MKILPLLTLAASVALPATALGQQLSGAGASFPAPLYQRWAAEFTKTQPDIRVNYQSIGSGAGVRQFTQGTVDFGASDAAMTDEEIAKVPQGVVMLPVTAGSIVIGYNLPGVPDLKLSREALIGIFMGTVVQWNDPLLVRDNPSVALPSISINVAKRSDGSGTTFVFSKHLSAISPEFEEEVGVDKSSDAWPVGVGGRGNEGVTALIQQGEGTLGYMEYGFAEYNKIPMASLQNQSGNFIKPTAQSCAATLASVVLPENLRIWPEDPAGAHDYPIVTFTWLLLGQKYDDAAKLTALKAFVNYSLTTGQTISGDLGYIPLPPAVVARCQAALATIK